MKQAYLDSNIFIYSILDEKQKGELAGHVLKAVQEGRISAVTSVLTFDEILYIVSKTKGVEAAIEAGEAFLSFNNLYLADANKAIAFMAIDAVRKYRVQPRDAIHYATMKTFNISEMVSEDKDFDKIAEIKRFGLGEFVKRIK